MDGLSTTFFAKRTCLTGVQDYHSLMKKFLFSLLALVVLVVSGCAGVQTIAINKSEPHAAIPAKDVQLALAVPSNAVLVADLFSDSCNSEHDVDTPRRRT